jgi:hypothetical protein
MAISLTGTGSLFARVGKIAYNVNSINSFRGTADLSAASVSSIGVGVTAIDAQYASAQQQLVGDLYRQRDTARLTLSGYTSYLSSLASQTLVEMANDDAALPAKTVTNAATKLITQMIGAGSLSNPDNDVNANTVTVSTAIGSANTGTATVAASVVGPDGRNREYAIAETITLTARSDSQSGTATEGRESWALTTPAPQGDQLSWDWPKGSGAATTVTAAASTGSVTKIVNGDFEDFTANVPDKWTVLTGVAGTDILRAATPYTGTYSLSFLGDGATLSAVRQVFDNSTTGTSYKLLPNTVYAVRYRVKMSSTPAAGVLGLSITNSSGTILTNDFATSQTVSKALTGVSTTWVDVTGFFQTPAIMNSGPYYLKFHLTTAITATHTAYIDDLVMLAPSPIYRGGPYVVVFAGATPTVIGDTLTVTVANDWGSKVQKAAQQFWDLRGLGLQLPSDTGGTETIADSVVGA